MNLKKSALYSKSVSRFHNRNCKLISKASRPCMICPTYLSNHLFSFLSPSPPLPFSVDCLLDPEHHFGNSLFGSQVKHVFLQRASFDPLSLGQMLLQCIHRNVMYITLQFLFSVYTHQAGIMRVGSLFIFSPSCVILVTQKGLNKYLLNG